MGPWYVGPYQLVHVKSGISSWRGARVDVRTYLLGGAIDSSEANGIIRDPKLEDLVGFTPRREEEFRIELVQGATLICEGSNRLNAFRKAKVVGMIERVARMRNGHVEVYGYAFWVNQCTSDFHGVNEPDDRRDTEGREDVHKVFQQRGSGVKRKLSRCGRNQMGNEPILALPEGADDFVVLMKDCMTNVMLYRGIGRRSKAKDEFELDLRQSDLEMESGSYWLDKVRTSIWRDVRTLAIEEAYMTKYSIHPGADTVLCGFRLTNRWSSVKGLQDCCYNLSYSSRSGKKITKDVIAKLPSLNSGYDVIGCSQWTD
ncbi:hypothetical protein Tco_0123763 [Tanacetum coccineum]